MTVSPIKHRYITITFPNTDCIARVREAAMADKRSVSNWIWVVISHELERRENPQTLKEREVTND